MEVAPCKDCSNKGCGPYHDMCIKYKYWKDQLDEYNEKKRKEAEEIDRLFPRNNRRRR